MSELNQAITFKNEARKTLSLGLPLIASQMVYAGSCFVSIVMIAKLGIDALAASVLVSMIWMCLSVLFLGILNSISILISHQYGAKNIGGISNIMGQSIILGIIVAILLSSIIYLSRYTFAWSNQPAEVLSYAIQYTNSLIWLTPGLVILIVFEQFLSAINRTKLVLRISIIIVPVEIFLIYCLVFGKCGLPNCGIAGIGYGFAITYTITAIFLGIYLYTSKKFKEYKLFSRIQHIDCKILGELIRLGLPNGLMQLIEVGAFTCATFWMGQFGTETLAAHQIAFQYLGFTINLVFATAQTVTIRVGHTAGTQNIIAVKYASYVGMVLNFLLVSVIALAYYLFPTFFIQLDIGSHMSYSDSLIQYASLLLLISGILQLFDNFRIIGIGALRGLKDTTFAMFSSLLAFWVIGLITAYLFAFHWHMGGAGIWYGLTVGIIFGVIIVQLRLRYMLHHIDLKKVISKY